MIIQINKNNKIIALYHGELAEKNPADGVTFFEVEALPTRVPNTTLHFNPESKEFYTVEIDPLIIARKDANTKIAAAKKWLADNDWMVNKRTLGEWSETDERWLAYLADRAKARAEIDKAEAILAGGAK